MNLRLENTYTRLPDMFYERIAPVPVAAPRMVLFNDTLAGELGFKKDGLSTETMAGVFSGNERLEGSDPIAQAYAGHQFGTFTLLGDGRAHLLGEIITPEGIRYDLALKGSGRTRFSRRGDGRAALSPMLREYIISEAMFALGIPTTRSLSVVTTGEIVQRDGPQPGALLTRVAKSHIRVGTFEFAAATGDVANIKSLLEYAVSRHYPHLAGSHSPALDFIKDVGKTQAYLVARWMSVGFIHGVMNTDNMAISGETIDYGPCAFMDAYNPQQVFSSIDHHGRYAYGNQPSIAQWNLARLAETLLPLIDIDQDKAIDLAEGAINTFSNWFKEAWIHVMRSKLGLFGEDEGDFALAQDYLSLLHQMQMDFTNGFRELSPDRPLQGFENWHGRWLTRLTKNKKSLSEAIDLMHAHNPARIPRNHHVDAALSAANEGDLGKVIRLLDALKEPFKDNPEFKDYAVPPAPSERIHQTFCGT